MALLPRSPRRLGSHHVDGAAVDRRHEEGAQGAPAGIELLGVVPEPEEHLLDDLLGQGPVVEDPDREPERGVAVAAVGLGSAPPARNRAIATTRAASLASRKSCSTRVLYLVIGRSPRVRSEPASG